MNYGKNIQFLVVGLLILSIIADVQGRLVIQSPPELIQIVKDKHPQGIPYSVANYGDIPFGKSLGGTIYLPISVQENCIYEPLDETSQRKINKIVMSTRGDCTFTTKSLNSQRQGAKLAIIADNKDNEDPGRIILVDDGRGPQVHIPTIFIGEELGQLITSYIIDKKVSVSIVVNFETKHKDKANIDLWLDSQDRSSYILVRQLQPFLDRIQEKITLTVRHPTSQCSTCLQTDCYSDNLYCINTGFYGYFIPYYGRNLIRQQLRQQIILKNVGIQKWWEYMQKYDEECDQKELLNECSQQIMKDVGIDVSKIEKLIDKSFTNTEVPDPESDNNGTKVIQENQMLQENRILKYQAGIIIFPGILVNNITYRGNLQAYDVFEMVCNSLKQQPEGCNLDPIDPPTPWKYILFVSIIIILFIVFLVSCYRRRVRRQLSTNMNKQVNDLVNQYITMYETQRFEGQTPDHKNEVQLKQT